MYYKTVPDKFISVAKAEGDNLKQTGHNSAGNFFHFFFMNFISFFYCKIHCL